MRAVILFVACLTSSAFAAPNISFRNPRIPDNRIVGGWPVQIEEFPYQQSIQLLDSHWCGGSAVTDTVIISAAHCFDWPVSWYTIRGGSSVHNAGGQVIVVASFVNHPQYDPNTIENDIAVVILSTPLTLGASVQPIALPPGDRVVAEGVQATVTGWGALTEGGSSPLQLQAVTVPIVATARCNELYSAVGWPVTDSMVCAGYDEGGRDACQGDSGGPLTVAGELIGVVSWGLGCARAGFPGVYANVAYLRPFITAVTGL